MNDQAGSQGMTGCDLSPVKYTAQLLWPGTKHLKETNRQVWGQKPVIPVLMGLGQKGHKFKASLYDSKLKAYLNNSVRPFL